MKLGSFSYSTLDARLEIIYRYGKMIAKDIDKLIKWKVYDVLEIKERRQKGEHDMQYQFNIEMRVDCTEKDRLDAIRDNVIMKAREMGATSRLLCERVELSCFSDDFFHGQEEIDLHALKRVDGVTNKLLEALK